MIEEIAELHLAQVTVAPGAPKPADLKRLVDILHAYGYWLGSPADNAAAGISFG